MTIRTGSETDPHAESGAGSYVRDVRTDVEIGSGYLSSNRPNVRARITGFARMFRAGDDQARSADALVPGKQPIRELLPSPHDTTTEGASA